MTPDEIRELADKLDGVVAMHLAPLTAKYPKQAARFLRNIANAIERINDDPDTNKGISRKT